MKNIEDHITWAQSVASKFRNEKNIPIERGELLSLAMVGLMKAARNYDENKGKFRTFAWRKVRGEIKDYIGTTMRRKDRAPMDSLENMLENELPSVNGTETRVVNKLLVRQILASVKFRQAYALKRYYLDGLTLKEVGKEMVVTPARVFQILTKGRNNARKTWVKQI